MSEKPQQFETVARVGDIPVGKGQAFEVNGRVVAVFNDNGTFRAMDDICPHMGASLSTGHLEDSEVTCPWHAWRFDTRNGQWCDNAQLKVDTFELRIVDDQIQVCVSEVDNSIDNGDIAATRRQQNQAGDSAE